MIGSRCGDCRKSGTLIIDKIYRTEELEIAVVQRAMYVRTYVYTLESEFFEEAA